jgi:hypothetical protein
MTLSDINTNIAFLLQIGSIIVAAIFLIRALLNILQITDKATGLFLGHLSINEGVSRQRIFKDAIYIIGILLLTAAIFPVFSNVTSFGTLPQQIVTYVSLGLILLFVYDIGRTFYRITENKANSVADRISNSINDEREKISE